MWRGSNCKFCVALSIKIYLLCFVIENCFLEHSKAAGGGSGELLLSLRDLTIKDKWQLNASLDCANNSEQTWTNQILLWVQFVDRGEKKLQKKLLSPLESQLNTTSQSVSSTSHKVSAQDALKFWFRATHFIKYSNGVALHQATSMHVEIANTERVHAVWWTLYYF